MSSDLADRVTRLEVQQEHGVTKVDIAQLDGSIRTGTAEIKADAAERETRLVKWFVGSVVVVGGLASALTALIMRLI